MQQLLLSSFHPLLNPIYYLPLNSCPLASQLGCGKATLAQFHGHCLWTASEGVLRAFCSANTAGRNATLTHVNKPSPARVKISPVTMSSQAAGAWSNLLALHVLTETEEHLMKALMSQKAHSIIFILLNFKALLLNWTSRLAQFLPSPQKDTRMTSSDVDLWSENR